MVLIPLTNAGITPNNPKKCCCLEATEHFYNSMKWLRITWYGLQFLNKLQENTMTETCKKNSQFYIVYDRIQLTALHGFMHDKLMNWAWPSSQPRLIHTLSFLFLFPWTLLSFSTVFWTPLLVTTGLNIKSNITCHEETPLWMILIVWETKLLPQFGGHINIFF